MAVGVAGATRLGPDEHQAWALPRNASLFKLQGFATVLYNGNFYRVSPRIDMKGWLASRVTYTKVGREIEHILAGSLCGSEPRNDWGLELPLSNRTSCGLMITADELSG